MTFHIPLEYIFINLYERYKIVKISSLFMSLFVFVFNLLFTLAHHLNCVCVCVRCEVAQPPYLTHETNHQINKAFMARKGGGLMEAGC